MTNPFMMAVGRSQGQGVQGPGLYVVLCTSIICTLMLLFRGNKNRNGGILS